MLLVFFPSPQVVLPVSPTVVVWDRHAGLLVFVAVVVMVELATLPVGIFAVVEVRFVTELLVKFVQQWFVRPLVTVL